MPAPLSIRFLRSYTDVDDLPHVHAELAIVGRSNVGKSSLLNGCLYDGLTRKVTGGEGREPELATEAERLAAIRGDELAAAGEVLGVEGVTVAGYADGELLVADPGQVTATIAEVVAEVAPSTILTVADLTPDPRAQAPRRTASLIPTPRVGYLRAGRDPDPTTSAC